MHTQVKGRRFSALLEEPDSSPFSALVGVPLDSDSLTFVVRFHHLLLDVVPVSIGFVVGFFFSWFLFFLARKKNIYTTKQD